MDPKKKIFIIDDDSFLLDMYSLKFSNSNFDVTTASDPEIALQKLKDGFVPDVVLLDIMMPVMDGFELLEKLKEGKIAEKSVKIILSNRGQPSDVIRGQSLGVAGYIVKASSTPSEVIEKVNQIMKGTQNKT